MDHTHFKGQKSCQMCVQNQQEAVTKSIYRWVKSFNTILELNIKVAMIKMFEPVRNKAKQDTPLEDERKTSNRNRSSGKHRKP